MKSKRPNNQIILPETNWSQEQQQLLELAIVKYPKTAVGDRWVKIASSIPGKTKEECLARYKHLVEIVKAQKAREKPEECPIDEHKVEINVDKVEDVIESDQCDVEEQEEPTKQQNKGKPRNKRKERKNRMDFSSDEDSD